MTLRIGYRWATESADVTGGRTGMPGGDFIYGGKVFFLGQVIPAEVLEYQRKDKMVLYGGPSLVEAGDLVFCIWLEDLDGTKYDELDIPKELQAEVKEILESFARIEDTARPPAATSTTVPTDTPAPTATAETRSSEIVYLDGTWFQYANYQLGFSLKVPNTMVSFLGACKWNEKDGDRSFRPDPALVPVRIFEDVGSVYIAPEYIHELSGEWKQAGAQGGTRTCYAECNQVPNSLALLQDPEKPWFSAEMWRIVAAEVHSDDELDAFIKSRYGSGCSLGEKTALGQDGVYDVRIQGDGKDLSETLCPINYMTVVKYYPEGNKVIAWDLGQASTFVAALDYSVQHDQEMVESFRFLTETPAAEEGSVPSVDVVGWYGSVHSLPVESGFDDYLSVLPEGAAEVGLVGASPALESTIAEMRDKEPPNKYAHFWGALACGVSDYGGCQLRVTHMRLDGPGPMPNPDPVEGWEGTVVTNSAWAQIDDAFVLAGSYPVHFGIWSEDPTIAAQLEGYRNSGIAIRVWGQVMCGLPDANGCQIQVRRLEEALPSEAPVAEAEGDSYANAEYDFSFQYPASWAFTELPERKTDTGRCAAALVLTQETLSITIQFLHPSQCCEQVAWCGVGAIVEPTARDQVTIMGREASRTALAHQDAVKAVDVSYIDEDADLGLLITLRDSSETAFTAPEMATIPDSALVELEQILGSFESR